MAEHVFKQGEYAKFRGYSDTEESPIFIAGEIIRIDSISSSNMTAIAVADTSRMDTVFDLEIEPATQEEANAALAASGQTQEAAEPAPVEAKAKKAKPAKAKAAEPVPAEAPAPVAEAKPKKAGKAKEAAPVTEAVTTTVDPALEAPAKIKATKPAKVAAAPAPAPAPVAGTAPAMGAVIRDTEAVRALLEEGQDALAAAKIIMDEVENKYFTLGGVLTHIYEGGLHKSLGYDGKRAFANYVEQALGLQYRKAMYLIEIYEKVMQLGVDERRLNEIGWSKAKEMIRYCTAENFDTLVDFASSHSREELVDYVRENMVDAETGSTRVKMVTFKFTLSEEAAKNAQAAIDTAKGLSGEGATDHSAFEHIVSEWRSMTEGSVAATTLEERIAAIEATFGIKLAIVTAEDEQRIAAE